ncbi:MAG TPA: undecaprenyl-diphosphatase UppP [Bacteroidota bacterium]|nr:undecaprenyl-diphosphatase UppP [Bacteroidota bacterium]
MSLMYAALLGLIQGLTEFLPVSSTAHLTIAAQMLGLINPGRPYEWTAFMAVIQIGTLAAVVIYFFEDLVHIVEGFFVDGPRYLRSRENGLGRARMGWYIILGTLPVATLGLAFKKIIEGNLTKSLSVIGTSLIVLALILWVAEKVGSRTKDMSKTTWLDSLIVGFAQSLALIPGSSRSGTTITAGLFLGMTREDAARFSFLLSVPAVFASGMLELYEMRHFMHDLGVLNVVVATLVAGIVGYASIAFLLKYLRTHTTYVFIFYRIVLGIALLVMAGIK